VFRGGRKGSRTGEEKVPGLKFRQTEEEEHCRYSFASCEFAIAVKGEKRPFSKAEYLIANSTRLHRPQRRSKIASTHSSRNLGPESGETASKLLTCIGVVPDAAEQFGEHA
jgi:hypothetical protein